MIKMEKVFVANFEGALRGARNSWESWSASDSGWADGQYHVGDNDFKLAFKLSKAGNSHAKYLRQIFVSVDIIAPLKWWDEMDTYKVGTVSNSTSMMHTLGRDLAEVDDFSFEDLDRDLKAVYMRIIREAQKRWHESGKRKPSREWRQMIMLTSVGFNYRRTFTANYQVLKSIYFDRRNHRLSEWRTFCDWIESLPYSELITLKERA